ncbi:MULTISPECIES: TonB family protein [unclassified Oceanobacter]|uniref:TonB family protein n=1 Tax=unclassified Oceanobacter TaxID=2620260 RepID=UPI0026E359E6|nr:MULTISPECIES: TonB family protein [unclassified Oceanobacter]MDO6680916.1 TonB family protein [Oceanobacter sp. 5_MG-2023]MDP2504677.1 TonB family protein [Oceanobacter sp. 3_MG-2023]MDP2607692.1 TonB family protein [Oceanobacter sp. 1_MG-2023]MDP2611124.1 TonB family protein [Oceanobacter sp. 2_MG-2023]
MSEALVNRHEPILPWVDTGGKRYISILVIALLFTTVLGILIPMMDVPEPDRSELEKIPPALAKLLEQRKPTPPPPPPPPPEEKVEEPKPEVPKPEVADVPKPRPKPVPKVEAKPEERKKAQEKVKEALGSDALNSLAALAAAIPNVKLDTSSAALSNVGSTAVSAGSVVDPNAVIALSGIDESTLTAATSGEQLGERTTTAVAVSSEEIRKTEEAGSNRTQEEMRLVFETSKQSFFNAYRRAQQKDPTLAGTVVLALKITPSGTVQSCEIGRSELNDEALHKRLLSQCRRMRFKDRPEVEVTSVEFPINFVP